MEILRSMSHSIRQNEENDSMPVLLISIFWTFFRIGLFTLGGGLAMSLVMRHELVIKRRWVKDADFMSLMSLATVVPGAIAVNIAYLLGRRMRSHMGAVMAVLGTILPSFFVILLVAGVFLPFISNPKVTAFFRGCAIAIVSQLAFTGFIFGRTLLRNWKQCAVCAAGMIPACAFGIHPIFGIITAGVLGYWLLPKKKPEGAGGNAPTA